MTTSTRPDISRPWQSFIRFFFFGNYFYGICAVALSIEASLQQQSGINPFLYYCLIFFSTIVFYTKAYLSETNSINANPRIQWYAKHSSFIGFSQIIYFFCALICAVYLVSMYSISLFSLKAREWLIILIFPVVAFLYYGLDIKIYDKISLRNIGWLKPFVIGFVWAGIATIYPVLFNNLIHASSYIPTEYGVLLFIKNMMFVTMLCVLFDIKDYAADGNQQIKTFVVKFGLRKTIFSFVIPLTSIGLGSFMLYGYFHHFHPVKIMLNMIPFLSLICFAYLLHKPKSILFYLILIDGLMLVKAICGSIAMIYF